MAVENLKSWLEARIADYVGECLAELGKPVEERKLWKQAEILVVTLHGKDEPTHKWVKVPLNWYLNLFNYNGVIRDIVVVRGFASKKQMQVLFDRGLNINGKIFRPLGQTASMARQVKVYFTSRSAEIAGQIAAFLSPDTAYDGNAKLLPKVMARMFQSLSAGITVGAAAYLRDYNKLSEEERKLVKVWLVPIDDITVNDRVVTDGSGLHSSAVTNYVTASLKPNGKAYVVQVRAGGVKGTTQECPDSIWYEVYKKYIVPEAKKAGVRVNPGMPFMLVTKSMEKFVPGVRFFPFTVLRTSVKASEYVRTTYQLLQNLKNDANVLGEIAEETFAKFYKVSPSTPPEEVLERLGLFSKIGDDGSEEESKDREEATTLFRIVKANPEIALKFSPIRRRVMQLFQKKVLEIARGRVVVSGSFTIMLPDPGVFVGKPFLKSGEYYSMGLSCKALLARFPMASPGEPQVVQCRNDVFQYLDGYNITIFNPYDGIWEQMSGADFDGDICLATPDERLISLKLYGFEVPSFDKKEGKKKPCTYVNMCKSIVDGALIPEISGEEKPFTVGMIANLISSVISSMHEKAGCSDDPWDETFEV